MNAGIVIRLAASLVSLLLAAVSESETLAGSVFAADGRPVAGALVSALPWRDANQRLLDEQQNRAPKPVAETRTNELGAFTLALEGNAGDLVVRVSSSGRPDVVREVLAGELERGETLDLALPESARYTGRVTDEAGIGLAGTHVRLTGRGLPDEGDPTAETVSGADGRFEIPNGPEGEVRYEAFHAGYVRMHRNCYGASECGSFVLRTGGAIEGSVADPSGAPAVGVLVFAEGGAGLTDAAALYRLDGIPAGRRTLRAGGGDGLAAWKDVTVQKGIATRADLALVRVPIVEGIVLEEKTQRPIAGARVKAATAREPTAVVARAISDARGRFRFGLAPGEYGFRAERRGYLSGAIAARANAGNSRGGLASISLRRAGAIAGRVVDEKGSPVAGARVERIAPEGRRASESGTAEVSASSRARAGGTFRLGCLPPGDEILEANREGFAPTRRYGLTVRGGETTRGVVLTLRRGLEAKGSVVTQSGDPVPGGRVRVHRKQPKAANSDDEERPSAPPLTTDARGGFVARGLSPGTYEASVEASGFATRSFTDLAVAPGSPTAWTPFVLSASAPVSGFVRNSRSEPVPGATIWAYGGTENADVRTLSDADGRFRIDGWPAGATLDLNVRAEGYATLRRSLPAPSENVALVLSSAATVRGRVEDGETQKPLQDFGAGWARTRPGVRPLGLTQPFQDPAGAFELTDIAPGRVTLFGSAPGYIESDLSGLELQEGEVREGIVLSLKKGVTVTGRVLEPVRGKGVANATVAWGNDSGDSAGPPIFPADPMQVVTGRQTSTDSDGGFRLEGVPQERIILVATHADYVRTQKPLDASAATEVDLILSVGATISGTVVSSDGTAVVGAAISLDEPGTSYQEWSGDNVRSGADGAYAFERLREGRYRVTATAEAGQSAPVEVVLDRGEHHEGVKLEIRAGTLVLGHVTGSTPQGLASLVVSASSDTFDAQTRTDDAGNFRIAGVPPGPLRIAVATSVTMSGRSVSKHVEVPPDTAELPVEIGFEPGSRLSGRVLRGDRGLAASRLTVSPDPQASGAVWSATLTDEAGAYAIDDLPDGTYQVDVWGDARTTRPVTISGDTKLDITFGASSVSGLVTDRESGEPLPGAAVQADAGKGDGAASLHDGLADGRGYYEIPDLDPGTYQLTARASTHVAKTEPVAVSDSSASLDFSLERGSGLEVHGFDGHTGIALRALDIAAFSAPGAVAYRGTVALDGDGRGQIPSLAPGQYRIWTFAERYAPKQFLVSVPTGPLEVGLTQGGRVEIRSDVSVSGYVYDSSGTMSVGSTWRPDGQVAVYAPATAWENFAPGAYQLVVADADGQKTWSFTVEEGKTSVLELK